MVMGVHEMNNNNNNKKHLQIAFENYVKKKKLKDEIFKFPRNIVRAKCEELDSMLQKDVPINITISCNGTWHKRGHTS